MSEQRLVRPSTHGSPRPPTTASRSAISGEKRSDVRRGLADADPTRIVTRWVEAFNARDLPTMLRCFAEDVDFHPLRAGGHADHVHGHDGVRWWFAQLTQHRREHRMLLREVRHLGPGRVLATGVVTIEDEDAGPFCAVDVIRGNAIVSAHHYYTDVDTIDQLGML